MSTDFDVTILGAGLAGLGLARRLLKMRPQTRLLILDKRSHPAPEAAFKVGESSVEMGSHYLESVLGLGDHLKSEQLPKYGLRFFFGAAGGEHLSDAFELGPSKLFPLGSYQTDRGRLENRLVEDLLAAGAVFRPETRIGKIDLNEADGVHRVHHTHAGQRGSVTSRWVVEARGRAAGLKRQLGLMTQTDHQVNAVWWRIEDRIRIDDWGPWRTSSEGINADRWLSTIHLMGEGYWVWIIPLASGCTSIGIVADPRFHPIGEINSFDRAMTWLKRHQPQCARELETRRGALMDFKVMKRFSYGSSQVFSEERWALTGEAGVFPDPFYSPGTDFIGVANGFIEALILRDLKGRSIAALAPVFDQIFLALFDNTMFTYRNQYEIFGNPAVMTIKVMWDYAMYWSFPAFVYIQGRLANPSAWSQLKPVLSELPALNQSSQAFFRALHRVWDRPAAMPKFVDQFGIDLLARLNTGLTQPLGDEAFRERALANLAELKALHAEIVAWATDLYPQLNEFRHDESEPAGYLTDVLAHFT